jgi:hypothetical protein
MSTYNMQVSTVAHGHHNQSTNHTYSKSNNMFCDLHVELEDDCILQQGFDDPQCDSEGPNTS